MPPGGAVCAGAFAQGGAANRSRLTDASEFLRVGHVGQFAHARDHGESQDAVFAATEISNEVGRLGSQLGDDVRQLLEFGRFEDAVVPEGRHLGPTLYCGKRSW